MLLANFAPAADKGPAAFEAALEAAICSGNNPFSFGDGQSGTFRFIRTAAKAFTQHSCDKAGVYSYFQSFLDGRSRDNKLITFYGHRFNVAFCDAAAVLYHKDDISAMLDSWPNPNQLLKSVGFDIREKVFIAGARAKGMVHKLVTGPFQTLLSETHSILDISKDLHQIQLTLQSWTRDGSLPLGGEKMFSDDRAPMKKDELYDALFKESGDANLDSMTQMALELICAEMLVLLEPILSCLVVNYGNPVKRVIIAELSIHIQY